MFAVVLGGEGGDLADELVGLAGAQLDEVAAVEQEVHAGGVLRGDADVEHAVVGDEVGDHDTVDDQGRLGGLAGGAGGLGAGGGGAGVGIGVVAGDGVDAVAGGGQERLGGAGAGAAVAAQVGVDAGPERGGQAPEEERERQGEQGAARRVHGPSKRRA